MSPVYSESKRRVSVLAAFTLIAMIVLVSVATMPIQPPPARDPVGADASAFSDRVADTQDARLALADAAVEKAIGLLKLAENPTAKNPDKPFGGHRDKAVSNLERARQEIAAAQAYAIAN